MKRPSDVPRRKMRWVPACLAMLIMGAMLPLVGTSVAQAYFEQIGAPIGSPCPDVLVIGARGSGEEPQAAGGTAPVQYELDPFNGMGAFNFDVYRGLHEGNLDLHVAYEGVQYAAEPVASFTEPSLLSNPSGYIANAQAGANWTYTEISAIDTRCKHYTKFVLTGYSQGAWVMHKVLNMLSSTQRKQVASVIFFGDPQYVHGSVINRVNSSFNTKDGVAYYGAIDRASASVPKDIQARTASYCNTLDPICQFPNTLISEHMTYQENGATVRAANFADPFLPAQVDWLSITTGYPPDATVNTRYSYTLATADAVGTVTWSKTSGAYPPGITLSAGKLTGKPTETGLYKFTLKAKDSLNRSDSVNISLYVYPNYGPTPPPCAETVCNSFAWGYNGGGALGNGTNIDSLVPQQVKNLSGVKAVSAGDLFSLAVTTDGGVWSWGWNFDGVLGTGDSVEHDYPTRVLGLTDAVAVASGDTFSMALKNDGTVWTWGRNTFGQLGNGTTTDMFRPVQVAGLDHVTSIAATAAHAVVLRDDGTVWQWGESVGTSPSQIAGLSNITSVSSGNGFGAAVRSDNTVWSWGVNRWGTLGNGTTTDSLTPVQVVGATGAVAVSSGNEVTVALMSDGTLKTWGMTYYLEDDSTTIYFDSVPTPVQGIDGVSKISAGGPFALALRTDGTVWAWGGNVQGQLGSAAAGLRSSATPIQIPELSNIGSVDAGGNHSLVIHN